MWYIMAHIYVNATQFYAACGQWPITQTRTAKFTLALCTPLIGLSLTIRVNDPKACFYENE